MMKKYRIPSFPMLVAILISAVGSTSILFSSIIQYSNAQGSDTTVVRDSQAVLLEGKSIPPSDYIHLYDATLYMIKVGHVAAKHPCDSKSETSLKLLIGQAPNLKAAELKLAKELSKPGVMCIYHADVESTQQGDSGIITDIALQNPTNKGVKFGPTVTVVIGVDEIVPGAEEAASMGNMPMVTVRANQLAEYACLKQGPFFIYVFSRPKRIAE